LLAASLYFIEKNNALGKYVNDKIIENNRNRPPVIIKAQLKELWSSLKKVKETMFYLGFVYLVTFAVFPGVTNYTTLTFLEKDGPWHEIMFVTAFNIFDTLGRYAGGTK